MYVCPGCGANIKFDPDSQKMHCEYCNSYLEPNAFMEAHGAEAADVYETTIYSCPECGGELISDDNTAATFCSFCGASTILESRISKEQRPKLIIPFKIGAEQCKKAYLRVMRRALFAPSKMMKESTVEHFRGIYMPYWVYSTELHGPVTANGKTSSRSGDYIITKHYRITTRVDARYEGLSCDGSASFSDALSDSIAPFDIEGSTAFNSAYLSGFYADTGDVIPEVYSKEMLDTSSFGVATHLMGQSRVYGKYGVSMTDLQKGIHPRVTDTKSAMYPVYFLSCRSGDRISYAVVNGQTGKVAADIPVDYKKYLLGTLLLAIPLFLLLTMVFTITPQALMIITAILALICSIVANIQLNKLYSRKTGMDDKGLTYYRQIHPEAAPAEANGENEENKNNENTGRGTGRVQTKRKTTGVAEIGSRLIGISVAAAVISTGLLSSLDLSGEWTLFVILGMGGLFLLGLFLKAIGAKSTNQKTEVVATAPAKEKWKTLIKTIPCILAPMVTVFGAPLYDSIYYGVAIACALLLGWAFVDLLRQHNELTTRPLPQFGKRGAQDVR